MRLRESALHPISPKTTAPQCQPIDRNGEIVEDYSKDREAWPIKKSLALLLKPTSPTPSSMIIPEGHWEGNKRTAGLRGSAVRQHIIILSVISSLRKKMLQIDSWCWVFLLIGINLTLLILRLRNLDSFLNVINICINWCHINNEWTVSFLNYKVYGIA